MFVYNKTETFMQTTFIISAFYAPSQTCTYSEMPRSYLHAVDRVAIFLLIGVSTVFQIVLYIDMARRDSSWRRGDSTVNALTIETRQQYHIEAGLSPLLSKTALLFLFYF